MVVIGGVTKSRVRVGSCQVLKFFYRFGSGSGYSKKFQGCFGFAKIMLKKFFATKKINNGSILTALVFSEIFK